MHIGDFDLVVRLGIYVCVHARLRLERLQIVRVRLEHVLDKAFHCLCEIDLHTVFPLLLTVVDFVWTQSNTFSDEIKIFLFDTQ